MLFPVVNFLKCVVTEIALFSIVAFKTLDISQGSVATDLRCGGIFSESIITNFLLILTVNNFENRLIFDKVKAYKNGAVFWGHPKNVHNTFSILLVHYHGKLESKFGENHTMLLKTCIIFISFNSVKS